MENLNGERKYRKKVVIDTVLKIRKSCCILYLVNKIQIIVKYY